MRSNLTLTILALTASVLATPTTKRNGVANYSVPQMQIRDLEITILNIINDIVQQSGTAYDTDYATGSNQYSTIINSLQGPRPCGPNLPPPPSSREVAIANLQNSTQALQQLSLDLMDGAYSVAANSFNDDICWGKNAFLAQASWHP
ncbi:hypothetical protein B0A55_02387 [Friedmanniomyces simplex]|uniref:Uncharacterized protein n=1 Tax=Friedmanniomyces simplex TaxID=329884 RepID=A0A4U0Y0F8_9PEZI|nr:hypothetical protein B0A55_02387 [Friedmanniomyces simplex]